MEEQITASMDRVLKKTAAAQPFADENDTLSKMVSDFSEDELSFDELNMVAGGVTLPAAMSYQEFLKKTGQI